MKQTLRNRCQIATASGVQRLSVPIIKAEKTTDVLIASHDNWQQKQWHAISTAYGESAFFDYYADDLKPFFLPSQKGATEVLASASENPHLFTHDLAIIRKLLELMDIDHELRFTETFVGETYTAFNAESTSAQPKSEFCILHSALNKPYYQVFREKTGFIPDLSILDLLFNLGPESACYLLA